jgi:DnaJ-domain-containing protein 1
MSLSRRLKRIVQAHLGDLRADPADDETVDVDWDEPLSSEPASSSDEASLEVPPDVAKAYRALEVPVGSDRETVKTGYRRMMKQYHQDRFEQDEDKREVAGEVSKRINAAYQRILEYLDEDA